MRLILDNYKDPSTLLPRHFITPRYLNCGSHLSPFYCTTPISFTSHHSSSSPPTPPPPLPSNFKTEPYPILISFTPPLDIQTAAVTLNSFIFFFYGLTKDRLLDLNSYTSAYAFYIDIIFFYISLLYCIAFFFFLDQSVLSHQSFLHRNTFQNLIPNVMSTCSLRLSIHCALLPTTLQYTPPTHTPNSVDEFEVWMREWHETQVSKMAYPISFKLCLNHISPCFWNLNRFTAAYHQEIDKHPDWWWLSIEPWPYHVDPWQTCTFILLFLGWPAFWGLWGSWYCTVTEIERRVTVRDDMRLHRRD